MKTCNLKTGIGAGDVFCFAELLGCRLVHAHATYHAEHPSNACKVDVLEY